MSQRISQTAERSIRSSLTLVMASRVVQERMWHEVSDFTRFAALFKLRNSSKLFGCARVKKSPTHFMPVTIMERYQIIMRLVDSAVTVREQELFE